MEIMREHTNRRDKKRTYSENAWEIKSIALEMQGTYIKLDGVGLVDNRPSTDLFGHFVRKKLPCDTCYVTCCT